MSQTTVRQLIEVLSTLPQDAIVGCGNVFECGFSVPDVEEDWSLSVVYKEVGDIYGRVSPDDIAIDTLFQVCQIDTPEGTKIIIEQ